MTQNTRIPAFDQVLLEELRDIAAARATPAAVTGDAAAAEREVLGGGETPPSAADARKLAQRMQLRGLAFSGGGIRSATFNLGVLQALCEHKLLGCFDYLSTVSGGGYIGSWVSAQLHAALDDDKSLTPAAAVAALESTLSPSDAAGKPKAHEAVSIGFLRRYSNYLTPRVGLLSTDSLAAVSTYFRNVLLVQTMVIALLLAALLVPRMIYTAVPFVEGIAGVIGTALLFVSAAGIGVNLRADKESALAKNAFVLAIVVVPAMLGAFFVAIDMLGEPLFGRVHRWIVDSTQYEVHEAATWALCLAALYGAVSLLIGLLPAAKREHWLLSTLLITASGVIAGALGGAGLWVLYQSMSDLPGHASEWFAVSLAPFAILYVLGFMVVVHLGLIGRVFDYQVHEWWARDGGWIIGVSIGVGGTFAVAVYGPALVEYAHDWTIYAGGPIWLLTTLFGVLAGKSGATSGKASDAQTQTKGVSVTERLLPLAPYVFIFGLALALAYALYRCFGIEPAVAAPFGATLDHVMTELAASTDWRANAAFVGCLAVFLLYAWRVDINLFSFHNFYRNRLTRCYLGAARAAAGKRRAHPFTGFDDKDDLRLACLVAASGTVQRPYHILNTTLNMSSGTYLAWQQRKAASFFFTPGHCGFELPPHTGRVDGGFMPTRDYMPISSEFGPGYEYGPMLGSVVAVSGAAASPNWGFHTSTAVAFLLTLFNVRLGRWCPNTGLTQVSQYQSPAFGGGLLLQELFGQTSERSKYVYLSDGGHFDNLGIYELVRRRASLIIVGDCGQDIPMRYDDLADAVRKCYTDFGVCIDLDVGPTALMSDKGKERFSRQSVIQGKIRYPALGSAPAFEGVLFLVKPTLSDLVYRSAPDIRNYALANEDFPQQTTIDQFFDEAQFESYRRLGYLIGKEFIEGPAWAARP